MVPGAVTNASQTISAAAFRIGSIETTDRQFHQIRNCRESADGHQRDGSGLTRWTLDAVGHEQTETETERCPRERQKRIEGQIVRRFRDGNGEGHWRIPIRLAPEK